MALNPVAYTEKVLSSFLRYQLTAYPFSNPDLYAQMRALLSLEETRRTSTWRAKRYRDRDVSAPART
jgi:hypothetical protein